MSGLECEMATIRKQRKMRVDVSGREEEEQ